MCNFAIVIGQFFGKIVNKLSEQVLTITAYGSNAIADMLLEFAGKHMPERLADIENGHNEVYEKRHQRIEEKKAVLLVQEQAKQEAEQTEADADNEKQPQSQEVAA